MDKIKPLKYKNGYSLDGNGNHEVLCPRCGFECSHVIDAKIDRNEDEFVVATMECEDCWKHWNICIYFHGGSVLVYTKHEPQALRRSLVMDKK